MERIPQSATKRVVLKAYLSTDHVTAATSKTVAVVISKNGAAFGNTSGGATNATEIASGWYYVDLSTTDTGTLGPIVVRGTCSGVDDIERIFVVASAHNAGFDGIPDVIAGASTGLPLSVDASGRVDVLKINGVSQTGRDIGASVLLSSGAGTGQLDFTSGVVKANLAQILGTALTETSGLIAAGFKQFFNISSPTSTMNTVTAVTTTTNLTNAPTSGDFTTTMKTSLNSATPAVTVSDKTGFSLSSAGIQAIWDKLTSALTAVSSIGKLLVDNIDTTISSRLPTSSYSAPTTPPTVVAIRQEMDSNSTKLANLDATISSRLASGSYTAPDNSDIAAIKIKTDQLVFTTANQVDSTVVTNSDKTGYTLSAAGIDAILDDTPSAELSAVPNTTSSLRQMVQYIFTYFRNKKTVTGSTETLFKENASSTLGTASLSDDGSTFTKGEMD